MNESMTNFLEATKMLFEGKVRRLDGEFNWEDKNFKWSAYKISQPIPLIRIDIREKEK